MSVAINQSTRKHLMATPTTAAAPPIQRPTSRHTPRSREPPRTILSVCILEILPPNIQKGADGDAISLQQSYRGARDEVTHSYISIATAPPSQAWGPHYRGHGRQRPPKPLSFAASAYSSDTCFKTDNQRS